MEASIQTKFDPRTDASLEDWQIGTIAGLAGSILFGVLLSVQNPDMIEVAIPTLYGLEGGFAGTVVHLLHGVVLGVTFVILYEAIVSNPSSAVKTVLAGVGYGVVVWATLAAIVMPLWLSALNFALAPDVPNPDVTSLVGHITYGLVLGLVYWLFGR